MNENQPKEGTTSSGQKRKGRPPGSKNKFPSIKKQKINKVDNQNERAAKGLATFSINEQYASDVV